MQICTVRAHWDAEAQVWWADSDDICGLVAEARTCTQLIAELRQLVPELLALNTPDRHCDQIALRMASSSVIFHTQGNPPPQ